MFWFRLAARLGMSIVEAQSRIDAREFAEWMAYDRLSPIGDDRADASAALVAYTVASVFGGRAKFEDFMPEYGREERKTPEAMQLMIMSFASAHNARCRHGH